MYPIKYIDNNLAFNQSGECFAYYELKPYNYSFLSAEEKKRVQGRFRQLVAQSREGRIHALEIATESSIKKIQDEGKQLVQGQLREVAEKRIDGQTEKILDDVGENQIEYRFFIGFKLIKEAEEMSVKTVKNSVWMAIKEFFYSVNHVFMDDYVNMPNEEIDRYAKIGRLISNKMRKYFEVRRLDKNDFGYLIEHNNGQAGRVYEDYEYQLPIKKQKKECLIKKYDLLKLMQCEIEEHRKYLKITGEDYQTYVAYFVMADVVGELEEYASEVFYYQQADLSYPIDTSMHIEIVPNQKAVSTVRNKKKELKDLENHAYESDNEASQNVLDALDDADELEQTLEKTKDAMYKLNYVIRVSAVSLEELNSRCNEVRDYYDTFNIKLIRPSGDMLNLHNEFIPSSKRSVDDYVQEVTPDFIAALGFGATQMIGEKNGVYMGWNVDTEKSFYLIPWLAAQGVKGSITNALAVALLGSLGGGKSQTFNQIVYNQVIFGAKALIIDPKAERKNWKTDLPDIAHVINNVNLTNEEENRGLLDPFIIMQTLKNAESLALNILTFLTGITNRDNKRFPVLKKAISAVGKREKRGMIFVVDELNAIGTEIATDIAEHIESFTDYDFAQLLFSDGNVRNSIHLDNQLNIISVENLVLPEKESGLDEYTMEELISVAMLIVISTFALDFIHSDREVYKIVGLDEAWTFLQVAQGKALSQKLVRAGRSMNAGVYFITQNTDDLSDEKMKNNIGLKFAFRSTDITEIKKTLIFFGLDAEDEENQERLRNLKNGECLFQDLYGRVAVVYIDAVFDDLKKAFDTRPPMQGQAGGD